VSDLTPFQILIGCIVVVPLVVYLVARLATAAFFKSKATYDMQRKHHG